ncbi:hypothetical protein J2S03_003444 [Alicyclobacillus cycloheptanicus]|uniref:Uncharacterized protein n=1 Tax=Alicyclobacillus cycloheptanicus TaxID=1457 RepID=A0ABT9XMM4_9BACL|nr:hypothetical protein [Alicyclobacillus cycloheptanicus]
MCKALPSDLMEHGLKNDDGILVIIDGSKALRAAAVRDVLVRPSRKSTKSGTRPGCEMERCFQIGDG